MVDVTHCPVCKSEMKLAFSADLLLKHEVSYFSCPQCGLLQTEKPYWLDEAYDKAIAVADTGLARRNISLAVRLTSFLYFELNPKGAYLDVAGGYGTLTR